MLQSALYFDELHTVKTSDRRYGLTVLQRHPTLVMTRFPSKAPPRQGPHEELLPCCRHSRRSRCLLISVFASKTGRVRMPGSSKNAAARSYACICGQAGPRRVHRPARFSKQITMSQVGVAWWERLTSRLRNDRVWHHSSPAIIGCKIQGQFQVCSCSNFGIFLS